MDVLKAMQNAFISFDIISSGPKLVHQGSETYTNFLGATLTLLATFLSVYINLEDLQNYIKNKDPHYTKSTFYSNTEKIQFNSTSIKLFFTLQNYDLDTGLASLIPNTVLPFTPAKYSYSKKSALGINPIRMNFTDRNDSIYWDDLKKCDDEFFKDYNEHLEYGQQELTSSQLQYIQNSSLCMSPKIKSLDIYSFNDQIGSAYTISIIFFNSLVQTLIDAGYKYPSISINYQHIVVNPGENYYDNATYFRKIWKWNSYPLTENRFYATYAKISKTLITRNRKLLFFKRDDVNTTYTIENLVPIIELELDPTSNYQLSHGFLIEMGDYHSSITLDYISLGDILSNYGGCSSAMFVLFQSISGFFVAPFLTTSLLNSSFDFHENTTTPEEVNSLIDEIDKHNFDSEVKLRAKKNLKAHKFPWKKANDKITSIQPDIELGKLNVNKEKQSFDNSNTMLLENVKRKKSDKTLELSSVMSSKQSFISNLSSVLDLYFSTRKTKIANGWQVFRMTYCGKLCIKKKDSCFINYISLVNEYSEISKFIKIQREIEMLKQITMNYEERDLFLLPSVSIKPNENVNDLYSNNPINTDFEAKLHSIKDKVKDCTFIEHKKKVLLKGLINSLV